ncbi:916_t:CDS:10, partial [Ambispora leptoticha]
PSNDEKDWVEDSQLDDECKAKVIGLKILVNNLLSLSEEQGVEESAKPVFKILWKLIKDGGEIHPEKTTSLAFKSRLRLAAARAILKLARRKTYDKMITVPDFQKLAMMIQDTCYNVRYGFASRLIKYCGAYQLSARFLSIFFLVAHEPTPAIRDMASSLAKVFLIKHSVAARAQRDNTTLIFEMSLVRLIHLISHTDFSLESNQLLRATKYIEFFLETIANAENISFLYYITGRIKQFQDLHGQENPENLHAPKKSDNLYILSDLAQHVIREKCKAASWTLPSYPGQVKLPADLFASLPTAEKMKEVMEKNYLPVDFIKMLEKKQPTAHSKQEKATKKPRSTNSTKKSQSPKKRRKIDINKPATPTRRANNHDAKHGEILLAYLTRKQKQQDKKAPVQFTLDYINKNPGATAKDIENAYKKLQEGLDDPERIRLIQSEFGYTPRLGALGGTVMQGTELGVGYEGVNLKDETVCRRIGMIRKLLDCLYERHIMLIRSPPMVGKMALAQLLEHYLHNSNEGHDKRVLRISLLWMSAGKGNERFLFKDEFKKSVGVSWNDFISECNRIQTILIVDEVQKIYKPGGENTEPANGGQYKLLRIVAFASYGYRGAYDSDGCGQIVNVSPYQLEKRNTWGIGDMKFTQEEFYEYFQKFSEYHHFSLSHSCSPITCTKQQPVTQA